MRGPDAFAVLPARRSALISRRRIFLAVSEGRPNASSWWRAGSVEPGAERGELGTHAVALVGPAGSASRSSAARSARVRSPRFWNAGTRLLSMRIAVSVGTTAARAPRARARDFDAAVERIEQQRLGVTEMRDDVVAGQPDAGEQDIGSPCRFDIDGREQDRQAAATLEHAVQHRVLRPVVLLGVPAEAMHRPQHVRDGERLCAGRAR